MDRGLPLNADPTFAGQINKQVEQSDPYRRLNKPRPNYGSRPTTMQNTLVHNETVLNVANPRNTSRYACTPGTQPRELGAPRPSKYFVREDGDKAFKINEEKTQPGKGIFGCRQGRAAPTIPDEFCVTSPGGGRRFAHRPPTSRFRYIPEPETYTQYNVVVPAPGPRGSNVDSDPFNLRSGPVEIKPTTLSTNTTLVAYPQGLPKSNRDSDPLHRKRPAPTAAPFSVQAPYSTDLTA